MTPLFSSLIFLISAYHEDVAAIVTFARFVVSVSGVAYCNMKKVYQNSFFEEITPAAVICNRGEPFYLGIMTHPLCFVGTVPHLFLELVDCQVFIRLSVEHRLKNGRDSTLC